MLGRWRTSTCSIECVRARRRIEEVQAGRHRRSGFRRRGAERARGQPSIGREQFLAGAAFHQAAGPSRLGLWPIDHRAGASLRLRSRQLPGLRSSNLHSRRGPFPRVKKILFQELNMPDAGGEASICPTTLDRAVARSQQLARHSHCLKVRWTVTKVRGWPGLPGRQNR